MSELDNIERKVNPFPIYQQFRDNNPVYYDPERDNWNVFCYDDVKTVLSDYENFSSQYALNRNLSMDQPFAASIISTDPPRHRQLRNLVTQAFTPKSVERLAPRIESIVAELLTPLQDKEQIDVIADLAYPLPVIVIAEMLGIPTQDRERFKVWSDRIVDFAGTFEEGGFSEWDDTVGEMVMYFMTMIQERKLNPQDDLISGLLQANIEGEYLSLPELLGFCVLLLVAGNETTTNLIGNAMLTFSDHPEAWQKLRQNPDLLPGAIEEVLRYRSPVQAMFRSTHAEAKVGGVRIPAHSSVMAYIGSANHDGEQFPNPETFDIERTPNRHLAFGQGIHYCLGAPLARLEARIALGALLKMIPSFELAPNTQLQRQASLIVYGVKSVPIQIQGIGVRE